MTSTLSVQIWKWCKWWIAYHLTSNPHTVQPLLFPSRNWIIDARNSTSLLTQHLDDIILATCNILMDHKFIDQYYLKNDLKLKMTFIIYGGLILRKVARCYTKSFCQHSLVECWQWLDINSANKIYPFVLKRCVNCNRTFMARCWQRCSLETMSLTC